MFDSELAFTAASIPHQALYTSDACFRGAREGVTPPNTFEIARKLSKCRPCLQES